ncbi:hypothetical protein [Haloglomus litoreum]|uniref:hypothetical protein n=1 Tax=Haloglomus litoreum TaxID=3034026 RepID=UPI0023E85976|nr:hypothetical protein [Haloglomus sp. DT116]
MDRTGLYRGAGIVLAVLGTMIAVGAFLTSLGVPTGIDGDSVLIGAGIAVAGAGAAFQFRPPAVESRGDDEPVRQ